MKRIQVAKPRAGRERSGHELLPPDPRDADVVRVKALARAASPGLQHGKREGRCAACGSP